MTVATGNYGRLAFGYETTFGSGGTATLDFGYGAKLTGSNINRNVRMLYNIGSPTAKKPVALQYEGTFGVDGILTNDNLFEAIFGQGSKEELDTNDDTIIDTHQYTVQTKPQPLYVEYGFSGDENILIGLKGCLIRSASISARINDAIKYKINCVYQKPVKSNPSTIDAVDPPTAQDVFTFVDANLTFMGQTFVVQDFSMNLDLGSNNVYGLGSAFTQDMFRGKLAVSGSATVLAQKDDVIDLAFSLGASNTGVTEPVDSSSVDETQTASLVLNGGDGRSITFDLQGVVIDKLSQDLEAGEMVVFSIDYLAMLASATYTF